MKVVKKAYILNLVIACLEIISVVWMFSGMRLPGTGGTLSSEGIWIFKYFTVDSNILMGIVAAIMAFKYKRILDGREESLLKRDYLLMLMGTASVSLTMFVTVFYLVPTIPNGWFVCFNNSNLFLHAVNPILSILAFVCFMKTNRLKFVNSFIGILPMGIYAFFYVIVAVVNSKDGYVLPGYDIYGFFGYGLKSGFVVIPIIVLVTFALSACLYEFNHIKGEFNEAITNEMNLLALLNSQQGELDAVLMYQRIADKIEDPKMKELILETAADEGRHGAVFYNLTGVTLKPKKTKAILVPCLMKIIGKRKAFEVIAAQEYAAEHKYDELVQKYSVVASVQKDEHMHGDRMIEISKRF